MNTISYILARGMDSQLINIAVLVAVALLIGLAKLAEKTLRKAAERQAEEEKLRGLDAAPKEAPSREDQAERPTRRYPPMPTGPQVREGPVRTRAATEPVPVEPEPLLQPVPVQHQPIRTEPGRPRSTPRQTRPSGLAPVEMPPVPVSMRQIPGRTVEKDIQRLQARLMKLENLRLARIETSIRPETKFRTIGGRLSSIQAASRQVTQRQTGTGVRVDLASIDEARMAIIYHEIFSAPKALRTGSEMWDM